MKDADFSLQFARVGPMGNFAKEAMRVLTTHGGPKWLKFQPKMPRLDTMRYWYLGIFPS